MKYPDALEILILTKIWNTPMHSLEILIHTNDCHKNRVTHYAGDKNICYMQTLHIQQWEGLIGSCMEKIHEVFGIHTTSPLSLLLYVHLYVESPHVRLDILNSILIRTLWKYLRVVSPGKRVDNFVTRG